MEQDKIDAANMALQKNDCVSAIKYYNEALAINKTFGTYLNLSVAYKRLGRFDQAIKCLQKSLQLNKNHPGTYLNYGNLLKLKFLEKQAFNQYVNALKIDPTYAPAYNSIGTLLRSHGELNEARKYFETAIKFDKSYSQAINNLRLLQIEFKTQNIGFAQSYQNNIKFQIPKNN